MYDDALRVLPEHEMCTAAQNECVDKYLFSSDLYVTTEQTHHVCLK